MKRKSTINYDSESDVVYIVIKKGPEATIEEVSPGINVELDEKGEIIGIEILRASKFFKPIAKPLYWQINRVSHMVANHLTIASQR